MGLFFQKTLNDTVGGVTCMQQGLPYTCLLLPFRMRCYSATHVIGAFTWNAATRRFQECQKVRRLHSLASRFPSRLSIQRLLSTDGRLRPSLRTRGDGLLEALHAYKIILASPGEICYLWITVDPTARLVMTATYGRMTICRQFIQVT